MANPTETQAAVETVQVAKDSIEAMAGNIAVIAACSKRMMEAGLKEETLVMLIADHSKVAKRDIKAVLEALQNLNYYRKQK